KVTRRPVLRARHNGANITQAERLAPLARQNVVGRGQQEGERFFTHNLFRLHGDGVAWIAHLAVPPLAEAPHKGRHKLTPLCWPISYEAAFPARSACARS